VILADYDLNPKIEASEVEMIGALKQMSVGEAQRLRQLEAGRSAAEGGAKAGSLD
jgi:hypothetical protein